MPKAIFGTLVQCDESIKAIIEKIDRENNNAFILESFDEGTLFINKTKMTELQAKLKNVIKDTVKEAEESGSD